MYGPLLPPPWVIITVLFFAALGVALAIWQIISGIVWLVQHVRFV